jgi:hypothetical protein
VIVNENNASRVHGTPVTEKILLKPMRWEFCEQKTAKNRWRQFDPAWGDLIIQIRTIEF